MTENPKFEHNFLDLKREGINDHTSLVESPLACVARCSGLSVLPLY